jgi:hypothetical protein
MNKPKRKISNPVKGVADKMHIGIWSTIIAVGWLYIITPGALASRDIIVDAYRDVPVAFHP